MKNKDDGINTLRRNQGLYLLLKFLNWGSHQEFRQLEGISNGEIHFKYSRPTVQNLMGYLWTASKNNSGKEKQANIQYFCFWNI